MSDKNLIFDENVKLKTLIAKFDLINSINNKVAIVVNKKNSVKGIITSGDLRRINSNKVNLETKIKFLMNRHPLLVNYQGNNKRKNLENIRNFFINKNKNINFLVEVSYKNTFKRLLNYDDFINDFNNFKVSIIGLGKVGLTLLTFLSQNHDVIDGVDVNESLVENLKKKKINFFEPEVKQLLSRAIKQKKVSFPKFYQSFYCNVIIICVGPAEKSIYLKDQGLLQVVKKIAPKIKRHDLVILRSTSPIGISRRAVKIIEKSSKLKCGIDFYFSYSPERAVEGNIIADLKNIPQIISGYSENCKRVAESFWLNHCNSAVLTESLEAAEIIKLTNNTYRDLTFAFSNLLGLMCSKYNINTVDLIKAANNGYSRSNLFFPSPGVGGYCLSKDPYLFASSIGKRSLANSILSFRKLNEKMSIYPYQHILQFKNKYKIELKKLNILILGLTFKGVPENDDTRLSSSVYLMSFLIKKKMNVKFYDTMLMNSNDTKYEKFKEKQPLLNYKKYNVYLIMNNHQNNAQIVQKILEKSHQQKILLFDGWSQINPGLLNKNISYSCIGQFKKN